LNTSGQLGVNDVTSRSSPVSVVGGFKFGQAVGGSNHSVALDLDGRAWAWGLNTSGQVGNNTIDDRSSPVSVVGAHSFLQATGVQTNGSAGMKDDGRMWSWGDNTSGKLGDNSTTNRSSPVSVIGAHSFIQICSSGGLKSDGRAWCWGYNATGLVGDNTIANRSSPVSVIGAHSFIAIDAVNHRIALKADGSAWCWGRATNGSLGDNNDVNHRSSPVSVVGAHSFTKIAVSMSPYGTSIALKADGSVWTWGTNTSGQLGDETTNNRSSPVSVVGSHSFINIAGCDGVTLGLKSDSTIWAWGDNTNGLLGDNSTTSRSSPISVIGNHKFAKTVNFNDGQASRGGGIKLFRTHLEWQIWFEWTNG
jgi:alpha-tubulin suppressor-like RCC1 family protein